MPRWQVADLQDTSRFVLLQTLGHSDIAPFVADHYWRKRSRITWAHTLCLLVILLAWVAIGVRAGLSADDGLTNFGFAVLAFIALIPVHEFIHGVVYRHFGADDVRYGLSLRKGYAYAIAHNFVVNQREFAWVALMPFLVINAALLATAIIAEPLRFFLIAALFIHTTGTSGDFAMLNYLWLNRTRELHTYDDAASNTSYFYAHNQP